MPATIEALKHGLRDAALRAVPSIALPLLAIRSRRFIERQARELGLLDLARQIAAGNGSRVRAGPFAGMALDLDALPVHAAPKLLGTYESELHAAIEAAIACRPRVVVNVGCAEGYYAVGLATRLPGATVHAFDADPKARRATARNAALNGVADRVRVGALARHRDLDRLLRTDGGPAGAGARLLVVDIDGGEAGLLDPARAPALAGAEIIVELHPALRAGVERTIPERFAATHDIERIEPRAAGTDPGLVGGVPPAAGVPADAAEAARATDERRGQPTPWMIMRPRPAADRRGS